MIVTVSGDPSPNSPTLHLAEQVSAAIAAHLGRSTPATVDLARLAPQLLGTGSTDVSRAVELVRRASLLVVATPTRQRGYAAVLKLFGEVLPADGLLGIGAVPVVTAPEPRGSHETHRQLADWLAGLGATVVDPPLLMPETLVARPRAVALAYAVRLLGTLPPVPVRPAVWLPA
ncbi:NAD(P)H-dependent FMN reductase [Micromonospora pisi]|uniref:NAD(P)H-dependent FMN reductase n=1 Tax=Micromonospora pisi TaxID=589240 RepID=A0A495JRP0_9ACTN|nr:NAD(P)H-dependent oxidoreductase [Micromonospora pisi]RKR91178.1 NAD(P)H-dependent FMN reductase [Micromonospora pisi]